MKRTFQCLIVMLLAIACGKAPKSSKNELTTVPPPVTPTKPGVEKKSPKSSLPNPETELMAQFKAFAIRKRDYAKRVAAEKNVKPPPGVWKFFAAVIAGDFIQADKMSLSLARMSGQYDRPPPILGEAFWVAVTPKLEKLFEVKILARWRESLALRGRQNLEAFHVVWPLVNEVQGAMEAVDMWHAKYLRMYMEDIIEGIPKGGIYFGGTDPGRFAITLGSKSHEKADPFFTITQNALASSPYLQYLRELYGERIYMPSVADNQNAFRTYLEVAQERMLAGKLKLGENVTLFYNFHCPIHGPITREFRQHNIRQLEQAKQMGGLPCPACLNGRPSKTTLMTIPDPRVSVQGTAAVMAINALLAKTIFNNNRENEFYLEESFPLDWMYPYLIPNRLILKLAAQKEFELASIKPSEIPLPGFKVGDVLTPTSTQGDTRLEAMSKGKFSIGAIGTNGVIQRIIVSDSGQYGIKPALVTSAIETATNVTPVRINVKMEPIKGTPFHRMVEAAVDPKFSGAGYKAGAKLILQSTNSYSTNSNNSIQSLESQTNSFLTVTTVGGTGSVKDITIEKGGRYIIMPPTEMTFANEKGATFRARVDFRRIPKYKKELPAEIIAQNRKDWAKYMALCVGNVVKPETSVSDLCKWVEEVYFKKKRDGFKGDPLFLEAKKEVMERPAFRKGPAYSEQKSFSKMRSDQAGMYVWRHRTTIDPALKARYAREADFAFRQAFALGPIYPEVAYKYVQFLNEHKRFSDAKLIAKTFGKTAPNDKGSAQRIMLFVLAFEERHWVAKKELNKALTAALEQARLKKDFPGIQQRIQAYQRAIEQKQRPNKSDK